MEPTGAKQSGGTGGLARKLRKVHSGGTGDDGRRASGGGGDGAGGGIGRATRETVRRARVRGGAVGARPVNVWLLRVGWKEKM